MVRQVEQEHKRAHDQELAVRAEELREEALYAREEAVAALSEESRLLLKQQLAQREQQFEKEQNDAVRNAREQLLVLGRERVAAVGHAHEEAKTVHTWHNASSVTLHRSLQHRHAE
jgi:hypothetical protein